MFIHNILFVNVWIQKSYTCAHETACFMASGYGNKDGNLVTCRIVGR